MADVDELAQGLLGFGHPVRIRCLVLLEFERTPSELHQLIAGPSLGTVSYHMRMLNEYGLIEQTRTEPRRGALAHFYVRSELADTLMLKLGELIGVPGRRAGRPPKDPERRTAELVAAIRSSA